MLVTGKTKRTPNGWFVEVKDLSLRQKLYPIAKPQLPDYPEFVTVQLVPNTTEESDEQVEYTARIFNNLN